MPKSLQEYIDGLHEREDLIWPKPPKAEAPKATPFLKPLSDVQVVAWNLYGTLLRIADGELLFEVPQEMRMQIALEKVDAEFNMWNSMYRKAVAPWKYLWEQYQKFLERQRMAATKQKGDVPEVESPKLWRQIVAQLEEKEYEYDADFYGNADELSEKIAYFYHASLQGVEAAANGLDALKIVAGRHVAQGLLADAQIFTLPQFLRCYREQGGMPALGDVFQARYLTLSHQVGVRKPSKSLYQTFLRQAGESGVKPNQILYVTSRLDGDLAVAKSLGMQTALYAGDKLSLRAGKKEIANPKLRPDRLLTDLRQIGELLSP